MTAPKRFVNLHAHTGASPFDGLGPSSEHFKFCLENGLDAHAVTEHGHMNSFAASLLFMDKWKKEGKLFKYIPGVEAYVHPNLEQWKSDKLFFEEVQADARRRAKEAKKAKEKIKTEIERITTGGDETVDIETNNNLTLENEEESKSGKTFNPVNRRHHLVILPKTSRALIKLFNLVSRGYLEGFYRFPRIDLKMFKEVMGDERDLIISSACLGGIFSYAVMSQLRQHSFEAMDCSLLDDSAIMESCVASIANTYDQWVDVFGRENLLLELQFNRLPAQDLVNRALIEFAQRSSLTNQLVVTADAHYPSPDRWQQREIYKKLGYLNFNEYGPDSIPKSRENLKAELYPKNATQIWDEYQQSKLRAQFYSQPGFDQLISDAIERTHDIAHQVIEDITYDRSFKFPQKLVPQGMTPFERLVELSKEGLTRRGLADRPDYVERLKMELGVIKKMKFSEYFVTLARVIELARTVALLGVARGSGGGSLTAYCLGITDLDPIKYDCRFDRFLNVYREGAPDIDIDISDRDAVLEVLRIEFGKNNVLPISNINTMKLKSLVKDLSKFYGIPFEEANEATKTVEQDVRRAVTKHGDDKNLFVLKYDEAIKYSSSFKKFIDAHPEIGDSVNVLFKEQRSLGRHAGGVVILDDAPKLLPLIINGGEPQTPWVEGVETKTLEPLGVIKYDLLGLETMRLIQRSIELILGNEYGKRIRLDFGSDGRFDVYEKQQVRLANGQWRTAGEIEPEDDVVVPLEISEGPQPDLVC